MYILRQFRRHVIHVTVAVTVVVSNMAAVRHIAIRVS